MDPKPDVSTLKFLYDNILNYQLGTSPQDRFITDDIFPNLFSFARNKKGILIPKLLFNQDKYEFGNNTRRIVNKYVINPRDVIYAKFDYPLTDSNLYLASFSETTNYQILRVLEKSDKAFKFTDLNNEAVTFKVSMNLVKPKSYSENLDDLQTLYYIEKPKQASDLFFVGDVDNSF